MNWSIRAKVIIYPVSKSLCGSEIITNFRHYQIGDFNVDVCFISDVKQSLEDWVCVCYSNIFPNKGGLSVSFEVNGNAVQKITHQIYTLWRIIPIGDEYVNKPISPGLYSNITREFDENRWLIVSISKSLASISFRHSNDLVGSDVQPFDLTPLTNVIILTVMAQPIASRCSD